MSAAAACRVSVCIANYNGQHLLRDCLDSVLAQDTGPAVEIEVIVHDDASNDASLALLRSDYPQVKVIASAQNVGFCIANNRMAEAASGDYLLLLNNDAALALDALSALLAEQGRINGPCILSLPQYDWQSGELVDRGCLLDPFYNPVPNLDPARHDVAYVIGACLWVARGLWHDVGGFPAAFGSIAEDLYLCAAARLRGLPVHCVDASGYRHRQGASFGGNRANGGLQTTYRRRALSERNKTRLLLVCTPGLHAWPLLLLHLLLLYAEGVVLSLLRRDARLWREVYAPVLPGLSRSMVVCLKERDQLQGCRQISVRQWWRVFVFFPRKLALLWRYGIPEVR